MTGFETVVFEWAKNYLSRIRILSHPKAKFKVPKVKTDTLELVQVNERWKSEDKVIVPLLRMEQLAKLLISRFHSILRTYHGLCYTYYD